jgi:hypothetical protein
LLLSPLLLSSCHSHPRPYCSLLLAHALLRNTCRARSASSGNAGTGSRWGGGGGSSLQSLQAGLLDKLTRLKHLHFGMNQIQTVESGVFDHLTSLTTLYVILRFHPPRPLSAVVPGTKFFLVHLYHRDDALHLISPIPPPMHPLGICTTIRYGVCLRVFLTSSRRLFHCACCCLTPAPAAAYHFASKPSPASERRSASARALEDDRSRRHSPLRHFKTACPLTHYIRRAYAREPHGASHLTGACTTLGSQVCPRGFLIS